MDRKDIKKKNLLRSILDGSILTGTGIITQLPFILFLVVLAIFYIGNRYHAEKVVRETAKIQKELKELRAEKMAIQAELMQISKQSEVAKLVKKHDLNLEESIEPPKKIVIND